MSIHTSALPFRRHALALALALATGAAPAATLNVSGGCTLINAINNANSDADADGSGGCIAGSGADILALEPNAIYTLTEVNNTTQVPIGLPLVASVITINGNGATLRRSSAAGTPYFRLIEVTSTGNLTLNKLQLTGGKVVYDGSYLTDYPRGGGIGNHGILNIIDSTISGNSAGWGGGLANYSYSGSITVTNSTLSGNSAYNGGGLYNFGSVTMTNSTISGNSATYSGSGIDNQPDGNLILKNSVISDNIIINSDSYFSHGGGLSNGGTVTLTHSAISGNNAFKGGGIWNYGSIVLTNTAISGNNATSSGGGVINGSTITLTNSTVSDNYSAGYGGGISNIYGSVTLTSSTLSGNETPDGGGGGLFSVNAFQTSTTLMNSIIANSTGGDCSGNGSFSFLGINLTEDGSCGTPLSGDPKLRTLLDNGGPTLTHALKANSPASAAADPTFCETIDQRDVRRPPACDLGAFERKTRIPRSIAPLVQFFDDQVAGGGISGNSPGQKVDQRIALRNQLLTAGEYRTRHLKTEACDQLARTLGYIDADNTPEVDDYVTGTQAEALAEEISHLRTDWTCNPL